MNLYSSVPNWVGDAGQTVNSFADFAKAPERLSEYAVPYDDRSAVLSPADNWGLIGSQTALYINEAAKEAYREGSLGRVARVDTFEVQNVQTHTTGSRSGSILVNASITSATTSYDAVKDTMTQSFGIDGLGGATQTIKKGDILTIADVWAVNPVTKARLPFLKQFVVTADATASASAATITGPDLVRPAPERLDHRRLGPEQPGSDLRRVGLHRLPPEHGVPQERLRSGHRADDQAAWRRRRDATVVQGDERPAHPCL
jgi:hypothetical protein